MKDKVLIIVCALVILFQACTKDKTTEGDSLISEISVSLGIEDKSIIDINKNEVYSIKPEIGQSKDIPLSYEWEVNHELVSLNKDYDFVGKDLGTYKVRLKVSNEDGSTFKEFTVRVNSQYEEGLIILAEKDNEEGALSFIPKFGNALIAQTPLDKVDVNSFAVNNPSLSLGKKPSDIAIRQYQFFVSAQEGVISFLNHNTLELEGAIRATDYPDFKPTLLNIRDNASSASLVLTDKGQIYSFAPIEFVINSFSATLNNRFAAKSQMLLDNNFTGNYFWEPANSKIWDIAFGFWEDNSGEILRGQDLIHFFVHKNQCYALTYDKLNPSSIRKTVFSDYVTDVSQQVSFTKENITFKPTSITLYDDYYFKIVYANGSKIYRWFFSTNDIPDEPYIQLDIPGEVTCLAKDVNNKELYVGVYDPNSIGLKGSVVIYDLETGVKKATFRNIADKPVKLLYKKRRS